MVGHNKVFALLVLGLHISVWLWLVAQQDAGRNNKNGIKARLLRWIQPCYNPDMNGPVSEVAIHDKFHKTCYQALLVSWTCTAPVAYAKPHNHLHLL
jgi:hypothetical protein